MKRLSAYIRTLYKSHIVNLPQRNYQRIWYEVQPSKGLKLSKYILVYV